MADGVQMFHFLMFLTLIETQESIATDPIDLESFKAATIQATSLDDAKKAAASDVFDSCMAANHSVPFEFFRFRSEHIPG